MAVSAPSFSLPRELTAEMLRLASCGFDLIPLGRGKDGKSPLCAFADNPPKLKQTFGAMKAYRSTVYGILLPDLLVVDADEFTPETEDIVNARFGSAGVQVSTPRGRHFWYRHDGLHRPNLRAEGHMIDVKTGATQYVVGPGSIRPDAGEYVAIVGRLGLSPLSSPNRPRPVAKPTAEMVPQGKRHNFLVIKARTYVEIVTSKDELRENLIYDRDEHCEAENEFISDAEVFEIVEWAWDLRRRPGALYHKRQSAFRIERNVKDALLPLPNGDAAFVLYVVLVDNHAHVPGKRFVVSFDGMKSSGLIGFGRPRFRAAVALLLSLGLLRKIGSYKPGKELQHYQLGLLKSEDDGCNDPSAIRGRVL